MISSPRGAVEVKRGCDAVEPLVLFCAAVIAFPVSLRRKISGIALGTVVLLVLNLLRIVTLYFVSVHAPRFFELMHVEVWQALFIFLALGLWAIWALRSVRAPAPQVRVSRRRLGNLGGQRMKPMASELAR
jgi:exosortase family protein XrtM